MDKNLIKYAFGLGYQHGLYKLAQAAQKPVQQQPQRQPKSPSAQIGTYGDNYIGAGSQYGHPNSYLATLKRNAAAAPGGAKSIASPTPYLYDKAYNSSGAQPQPGQTVDQRSLDHARVSQAMSNAGTMYPQGTKAYTNLVQNLIRAGQQNQQNYQDTGTVTPRSAMDTTNIGGLSLTDEQKAQIKAMQDSMAKARPSTPVAPANTALA